MVENGKTLKFQKKLIEEVDRIIEERPDLFYRTRTDFVADAIRRRVAALALEAKE